MKIDCDRKELVECLKGAASVATDVNMPILGNCRVDARDDRVSVYATDLDTSDTTAMSRSVA